MEKNLDESIEDHLGYAVLKKISHGPYTAFTPGLESATKKYKISTLGFFSKIRLQIMASILLRSGWNLYKNDQKLKLNNFW